MPVLTSCGPRRQALALAVLALSMPIADAGAQEAVRGTACVLDGRTLFVGGSREQGQCRGGVKIRLADIDVPDVEQRCATPSGAPYSCGISALNALEDLTWRLTLVCEPQGPADRDRALPAICHAAERDLAREMVRRGWAVVDPPDSETYAAEQAAARAAQRGLWAGRFDLPSAWRQERRR